MASKLVVVEQEEVLNSKGKNLIVSASAGSGKTSVMIRKILNHILQKDCHVDELLVLTYTKSAAEEMKRKLVDSIKNNLDSSSELEDELELVATSDISTFDSFCQRLVKKYFYVLNIDPSFGVLDSSGQNYFMGQSLNSAIKKLKEQSPEKYELLLDNFAPRRDEEKIKKIVLQVYNFTTSILDFDEFTGKNKDFYNKSKKIAENYLNEYYDEIIKHAYTRLETLKQKSVNLGFIKYVEYISNLLINLDRYFVCKNFSKKIDVIKEFEYGKLLGAKSDPIGLKDEIAGVKDRLKKTIDKMIVYFGSGKNVENSYETCGQLCNVIFELVELFINEYTQCKNKNNSYDFNDIERMTISLLQNCEICEQVKNTYKYIFVDEFQDANAIQEKIIFSIANDNLFFVGDTKQAIYAFRQSDPEIFLHIEKNFERDAKSEAKRLNCNFRTNKNILNFVNQIFNVIMTEKTAGLDYKGKAQFDPKAPYEDIDGELCVELALIQKNEKPEKIKPTKVYSVKEHSTNCEKLGEYDDECVYICNKIAEVLQKPIYDKEIEKVRNVKFSDITILLSKRGPFLNALCSHLLEVGIPYVVSANRQLEELYDNVVLYNLLKYSQNSRDDFALYSVISSPLFNFSDSELAKIKEKAGECNYFYETLDIYDEKGELFEKLLTFKQTVQDFSFNVKYKGIFYALSDILVKTNYFLKISFEDDYQNRKLNMEEFVNSFCESKYDKNLNEYLIYREVTMRGEKMEFEKQSENAVEISTMHSSKGLEYPIVILANLDADNFKSPGESDIKINKDFGIGVKVLNLDERTQENGIFYETIKIKNRLLEQSEKIRLLYVATTRAKNKLIMVGRNVGDFKKFSSDFDIMQCNNFLGLIVGALDGQIISRINAGEIFKQSLFNNSKCQIETYVVESVSISKKDVLYPSKALEKYVKGLGEYLNIDLKNKQTKIALKNSVSAMLADEASNLNFAPSELTVNEHRQEQASERGTLYHKVLEQIDFNNVNSQKDVEQFVDCNFTKEEIICLLEECNYENIYKNICILKDYVAGASRVLKEQKFVMNLPYNQIMGGDILDKVLIQGIIDLVAIKSDKIILIDYKLSNKSNEYLKQKYKKQIQLYSLALGKGFNGKKIENHILNLKQNKLIDMD